MLKQQEEGWNKELVRDLFSTIEASIILSIPVSSVGMIDSQIWRHTLNGQYSVKSVYKVVKEGEHKTKGEAGPNTKADNDRKLLGKIWVLEIKRNIQHFLWRVCNNIILVGDILIRRGIKRE